MKPTAIVFALACLDFVTASPLPTKLAAYNPAWALFKRGAHLRWNPANAYENQQNRKRKWERRCDKVLVEAGCDMGTIHQGEIRLIRNGHKSSYINVEGASSSDMEKRKRMRVFVDGSAEDVDDWTKRDRIAMTHARRLTTQSPGGLIEKSRLSWDPPDQYENQQTRKYIWEKKCEKALTRAGCNAGIIHRGETMLIRNGHKTSYVRVEGSSSMDMKNPRKMRIFKDGSFEDQHDWSDRDRYLMRHNKQSKKEDLRLHNDQKTLLFWDPADSYKDKPKKKEYWENRCDVALARELCDGGTIYRGERTLTGQKMSYVNVEAAPSMGMEHGKKLRVFQDGSSEVMDDWPQRDLRLIQQSNRTRAPDRRRGQKHMGPMEAEEASITPPAPAQEHDQDNTAQTNPTPRVSWNTLAPYKRSHHMRKSYEAACYEALAREGCNSGVIHEGHHSQENRDGTKSFYMDVSARRDENPEENPRYMRLFEDGSYQWYPQGRVPAERLRGPNPQLDAPVQRSKRRTDSEPSVGTEAQEAHKRPRKIPSEQESTSTQATNEVPTS